jgi:hypothetical protein
MDNKNLRVLVLMSWLFFAVGLSFVVVNVWLGANLPAMPALVASIVLSLTASVVAIIDIHDIRKRIREMEEELH